MKMWFLPALLALYWLPWLAPEQDRWSDAKYDLFLFESDDKRSMAVVTPDPFQEHEEGHVRAWRAEVHMRVGGVSVSEELLFRAESIEEGTLLFVETAWGREVHVFEQHPDIASGRVQRRRWLARSGGLEELEPGRTVF